MSVDVLCANFNNSAFLEDFLDSIYSSTVPIERVIIVDDASTDESLDVLENYISKRNRNNIIIVRLNKNVGFANALNEGIKYVLSDFVLRIDPDDILVPERVYMQLELFGFDDTLAVVGGQAQYFSSENLRYLNKTNMPTIHDDIFNRFISADNGVLHGTTMIKSSILKDFLYLQDAVPSEDYEIFSRIIGRGYRFAAVNEVVTHVRVHSGSVSNNLKYSTVEKLFIFREKNLGLEFHKVSVIREFLVLYAYRRYLYETQFIKKYLFASVACIFGIERLIRRGFRNK